jgi:hypothetical protein
MDAKTTFLLISTFLMGVIAGGYFYLTVFAPEYNDVLSSGDTLSASDLVIEGEMYGGCSEADACASFRLVDGRRYEYRSFPDADVRKGTLERSIADPIRTAIGNADLERLSEEMSSSQCASYVDGVDYRYTVFSGGNSYVLDTCGTRFSAELSLQNVFVDAWYAMEHPEARKKAAVPTSITDIVNTLIFDRFNNPQQ